MSETLESVLGLETAVGGFTDGKERMVKPVTMAEFPAFIKVFGQINPSNLWTNMLFPEGIEATQKLLEIAFPDEDSSEVMKYINAKNFIQIIDTISKVNGIELSKQGNADPN